MDGLRLYDAAGTGEERLELAGVVLRDARVGDPQVAAVLVYVISRRSCGWMLELVIRPQVMLPALLSGLYPALRMGRTSPAMALREERGIKRKA